MPKEIVYSCYVNRSREGEQFAPVHVLSYQIAGAITFNDGNQTQTVNEGTFSFCRRNKLIKFLKQPPEKGEFKTVSVYLDEDTLKSFSMEYGYTADKHTDGPAITVLKPLPLLQSFMNSLQPYETLNEAVNENLVALKLKEAILVLLKANPALKDVLFDFNEPGKIDLEAFMLQNYQFNVDIKRFAYLTGRSLATFKRDFEKIFHSSPSRWLQQKRLQEAYYLIKEKRKKISDVYLEVGFEDLSHFSFAFKKTFGVAPSALVS
ncbi:helix-turn-helix domain-containing protein [Chitinophaga arvensicola]|uniref:AraC-type DNA-binding protein n=1 Tax=Chitinophaga arvensicola TaxID=29529 RepID=A0A1I0S8E9_9BACT|nr:AraC family transcriptional regulator [Chitinophaga arvensicola]SEW52035.1 AraC-type DNA-binding protein [Chitinophaga arvensicola]